MSDVKSHIPNNLKRYRKRMGFSQKEVADMLGLKSASCISRWENGTSIPSWQHMFELSFLYSTIPNQFYGDLWSDIQSRLRKKKLEMLDKKSLTKNS
jgi:transcriptional regulator with XRE-family HTH domain